MSNFLTLPDNLESPVDDGGAAHLTGRSLPGVILPSTGGRAVDLSALSGLVVLYTYPMTGRPGVAPPDGWDAIPGARGCTPQACSFRDHFAELRKLGVSQVYGISTQTTAYQREAATRLHLPFPLLSDSALELQETLDLPTLDVDGDVMLKRLTMIARDGEIEHVIYPVFPPDRNIDDVIDYLEGRSGIDESSR